MVSLSNYYLTTISSPWINAGSLESLVVSAALGTETLFPATVSKPEKRIELTKVGAVPTWLVEGVKATWKATSLAGVEKPTPEAKVPRFQVTVLFVAS